MFWGVFLLKKVVFEIVWMRGIEGSIWFWSAWMSFNVWKVSDYFIRWWIKGVPVRVWWLVDRVVSIVLSSFKMCNSVFGGRVLLVWSVVFNSCGLGVLENVRSAWSQYFRVSKIRGLYMRYLLLLDWSFWIWFSVVFVLNGMCVELWFWIRMGFLRSGSMGVTLMSLFNR